jgi:L-histidine N-alpha-methyltransferase
VSAIAKPQLTQFALETCNGLSSGDQKRISSRYFYDELGSALFEAITLLPEYGLTRADERVLQTHSRELVESIENPLAVAELGSGSGRKTRWVLEALRQSENEFAYIPIDVSHSALASCIKELGDLVPVKPICADWQDGLTQFARTRVSSQPILLLFLGSSIGNLERKCIPEFLRGIRACLRPGDFFLIGADLVKDENTMLVAYDDPTGVTAAFNLNLLARMNRELGAEFDLRSFAHEVRWNEVERRIEMHLLCCRDQYVHIAALDETIAFRAGETIWTESSHKFTTDELDDYACVSGFNPVASWVDAEWPFVEALWRADSKTSGDRPWTDRNAAKRSSTTL